MIKIMSGKKFNDLKEYVDKLEIKYTKLTKDYETLKKSYDELERKYKKLKMEAFLKGIE